MRIITTIAASLILAFSAAHAEEPDTGLKGSKVLLFSDPPLSREQKLEAKRFRGKDYFAAMAVNTVQTDVDHTGAAWGYHDVELAKEVALKSCRFKAQNPSDCVLLLAVVPKNYDPKSKRLTVSEHGQKAFEEAAKWSRRKPNKYRAFAISGGHTYSYSRLSNTRDKAEQHALELCNEGSEKLSKKKSADWKKAVLRPDHYVCRVIHVFGPTGNS